MGGFWRRGARGGECGVLETRSARSKEGVAKTARSL